jgi:hypothetical protein
LLTSLVDLPCLPPSTAHPYTLISYTNSLFADKNPGFTRRISNVLSLESYSPEELATIAIGWLVKPPNSFSLHADVTIQKMTAVFEAFPEQTRQTENGGLAVAVAINARAAYNLRTYHADESEPLPPMTIDDILTGAAAKKESSEGIAKAAAAEASNLEIPRGDEETGDDEDSSSDDETYKNGKASITEKDVGPVSTMDGLVHRRQLTRADGTTYFLFGKELMLALWDRGLKVWREWRVLMRNVLYCSLFKERSLQAGPGTGIFLPLRMLPQLVEMCKDFRFCGDPTVALPAWVSERKKFKSIGNQMLTESDFAEHTYPGGGEEPTSTGDEVRKQQHTVTIAHSIKINMEEKAEDKLSSTNTSSSDIAAPAKSSAKKAPAKSSAKKAPAKSSVKKTPGKSSAKKEEQGEHGGGAEKEEEPLGYSGAEEKVEDIQFDYGDEDENEGEGSAEGSIWSESEESGNEYKRDDKQSDASESSDDGAKDLSGNDGSVGLSDGEMEDASDDEDAANDEVVWLEKSNNKLKRKKWAWKPNKDKLSHAEEKVTPLS